MSNKGKRLLLEWRTDSDKEKIKKIDELRRAIIESTMFIIASEKEWVSPKLMLRILFQALMDNESEVRVAAAMAIANIAKTNPIVVSRIFE